MGPPPKRTKLVSFGAAAVLVALALSLTYFLPFFRTIPWTLCFLAVVTVAWIGGTAPAIATIVVSSVGVYALALAPAGGYRHDQVAWFKAIAFDLVALFIVYLIGQRTSAMVSLKASEAHYRSVTENASDVVINIDSDSRILSINPAVKSVFGYEPDELIGKQMLMLMPERFRAAHLAGLARYLATGSRRFAWTGVQLTGLRRDGKEIPLEISFGSYTLDSKTRFTGFIRDISDRQRSHAALMQSEKLAAVGRLASSIAHEINNPLESVTNLLYLSRRSDNLPKIQAYLESAERELGRVTVIANQTLQFHKSSSAPRHVKCAELISGTLAMYQGRLSNAQVELKQRDRAQRPAFCVEGEMRQVLNNLIGNAIDALPRGGSIWLRTRDATDCKTGWSGVMLTVADDGTGMGPEVKANIFEPFFSTKGSGGVGLGLWISHQLVEQNRGRLTVRSSQRKGRSGTVFTLFLPGFDERVVEES